ncbi:MAG: hypothetical protein ACK5MQ_14065, partial [Pikeienuella sp.]
MDRTTEAIAHFIGVFHLKVDAARMRDAYESFEARPDAPEELADLPPAKVALVAPFELLDFDPEAKTELSHEPLEPLPVPPLTPHEVGFPELSAPRGPLPELEGELKVVGYSFNARTVYRETPDPQPEPGFAAPNETMTVSIQRVHLSDDDLLVFGDDHNFVDPSVFKAQLGILQDVAEGLSLGLDPLLEAGRVHAVADLDATVKAIVEAISSDAAPAGEVYRNEETTKVIVNGVATDGEMPDFKENLPQALKKPEKGEEDGKSPFPEGLVKPPEMLDPGHHIATGANLSVNETAITTNWLDAKTILVGGDVG